MKLSMKVTKKYSKQILRYIYWEVHTRILGTTRKIKRNEENLLLCCSGMLLRSCSFDRFNLYYSTLFSFFNFFFFSLNFLLISEACEIFNLINNHVKLLLIQKI
jgi:hypothetical protein